MGRGRLSFRETRAGELFCTRGEHWLPSHAFQQRASRRKHGLDQKPTLFITWCRECKRVYDKDVKRARARQDHERQTKNSGGAPQPEAR